MGSRIGIVSTGDREIPVREVLLINIKVFNYSPLTGGAGTENSIAQRNPVDLNS